MAVTGNNSQISVSDINITSTWQLWGSWLLRLSWCSWYKQFGHLTLFFQVLVLRELAVSAPTFFFQQVQPFFDNIFYAVWDPKQAIREGAVSALRACLILTTQRETKEMQKPQWYKARQLSRKMCAPPIWTPGKAIAYVSVCSRVANLWGSGERFWWDSGQGERNESWWPRPRRPPHPERAGSHQQHGRRGEGEFAGLGYSWGSFLTPPHLRDSACVRKWRKSRSSNWSMINTARSWWDLEPSLATSHLLRASSRCSRSSPTPSWACWATALLKASSPSELHRHPPRALW